MTERNWSLSSDHINSLQDASIEKLVQVCKQAHYVDVRVRINGEDRHYQADWIKWLRPSALAEGVATGTAGQLATEYVLVPPKWIPVDEMLPNVDSVVVAFTGKYGPLLADRTTSNPDHGWSCDGKVTHWMPLPAGPEKP